MPLDIVDGKLVMAKRSHKYGAKRTEVDGITFDSKREATRYGELKHMQHVGAIKDLRLQPRFELVVNGVNVGAYVADFDYTEFDGAYVVEDAKGMKTPVYRLKKKLVKALHGVEVREV